eukprot:gene1372-4547_t
MINDIIGVAVVGRQASKAHPPCEPLEHIIYTALDVAENHVAGLKRINSTESKFFLGSLYPLEDGRCYGYLTNTQIKFFVITRSVTHEDAVILRVFERLHDEYVKLVCNPFFKPDTQITANLSPLVTGNITHNFFDILESF